jgi:hypothetical protein
MRAIAIAHGLVRLRIARVFARRGTGLWILAVWMVSAVEVDVFMRLVSLLAK